MSTHEASLSLATVLDFIGGEFLPQNFDPNESAEILSKNPAKNAQEVLRARVSKTRVDQAATAAVDAQPAWFALSREERFAVLLKWRAAIVENKEYLADAIVQEIGKLRSEARIEVDSLINRFDLTMNQVRADLKDGVLPGFPNEALRWMPHGVVGVIGPFNFPLHLCHAHVVPALILGNTVVMKPSEMAPLCGKRYAEVAQKAGLPAGVLNVIHGLGDTGAAIVAHPIIRGIAFTGSWPVGRKIAEAVLDQPEKLVALEMGGKNTVIVCEDADLRQAVHEIVLGAYLTTGQRCTCTDRVLVHRSRKDELVQALVKVASSLKFGDPDDAKNFAGPMVSEAAMLKLERAMKAAEDAGASVPLRGERLEGGFFRTASIHLLPDGVHDVPGYTDVELFGPDVGIETFGSDDEAIQVMQSSPYGFATSVFTLNDERFERYFRSIHTGLLNRNRSTNQASPRLPFGGTGRSGNHRPAGSFAARNLAIPVAVQSNGLGNVVLTPAFASFLPESDFDALEKLHQADESKEASLVLHARPKPLRRLAPAGGLLPQSQAWLERLYAGDRVVRDKKPGVFDHARSQGAWFVSIDDKPLSVLDAMSQTATIPFGFNPQEVVKPYREGAFGEASMVSSDLRDESSFAHRAASEYAQTLRAAVPGFQTVSFAACGAEANEKAYALCMQNLPATKADAKKLLAFEGSFHGRTLLALYASHNPSKRVPFEIAGYEVDFAPYPAVHAAPDEAALLQAEDAALAWVSERLKSNDFFAVVIEPMQSEGGDRYVSARFHRELRKLTRAHNTFLIMDEVQCGFGLGGKFAWHREFDLVKADGTSDQPDCVIFAKRAQVGVVLSNFADLEKTSAFPASLVRGNLHAQALLADEASSTPAALRVENAVRERLPELEKRFGHRIRKTRVQGFAFAFDLDTPEELNAYLNQRFWRGAIVFAAGDRTVRYRLNSSFGASEIDFLFETIFQTLAWLDANPKKMPPAWDDVVPTAKSLDASIQLRVAHASDADAVLPAIVNLEAEVYEPARRDPIEKLRLGFEQDGIAILAEQKQSDGSTKLLGYALSAPIEQMKDVAGANTDPNFGKHNTLYTVALTVSPDAQGKSLGFLLKQKTLEIAAQLKNEAGAHRYAYNTGRNRVGYADAMSQLNDALGAYTVEVLQGQYEGNGQSRYYRIHLRNGGLTIDALPGSTNLGVASIERPFAKASQHALLAESAGLLDGPTINKITLCNYITPAIARATEWISALAPELPHLFFTSGRDETVDKSLRILRLARKEGRYAIGLSGGYVGHTTSAARSISCSKSHQQGSPYFDFPRVKHPIDLGAGAASSEAGEELCIAQMRKTIEERGGASQCLGIYLETLQERTGKVLSKSFFQKLDAFRKETGVPVVLVETSSSYYRSGQGAFAYSRLGFVPDILTWWTGGQLGCVHVSKPYFVATPLTFVSTWDGDELSLVQAHNQLRDARLLDVQSIAARFEHKVKTVLGDELRGLGLYRVLPREVSETERSALRNLGIGVQTFANGNTALVGGLDFSL